MRTCVRFALFVMGFAVLLVVGFAARPADAGKPTAPPPPMPIDYVLTWLPAPDGVSDTEATSINGSGIVAGQYGPFSDNRLKRACVWTFAGVFALHNLAAVPDGWVLLTARGINDAGQIAGSAMRLADGLTRIYRFDPATDTTPAQVTFMGDPNSNAAQSIVQNRPINNLGDVAYGISGANHTVVTHVQTVGGQVFQTQQSFYFNSISDARQLVGASRRWTLATGQVETFSTSITGMDINVSGHFAGRVISKGSNYRALRYQSSAQAIGPQSSWAYGINSSGDLVGSVTNTGVGFVFTDVYGYVDLDTLVVGGAGDMAQWHAAFAIRPMKITNHATGEFGEIAGLAFFDGDVSKAFVLTPIPAT